MFQRLSSRGDAAPVAHVERWIRQDVVGFQIGVTIVVESVAVRSPTDAPDRRFIFASRQVVV